ncbi:universal stress protein [Nocardioides sp. JQ2195]|uniref:universal stress protein n=1 Tax=Nocardioides sp. JQ2195 TaxID=2592334 RepID=UPI00143E7FB6|nr:universal stress protein [Nocardioides sp. JQ2195]QIX25527.1 universal stress protein [Nocardioides sp. JQ2195]
MTSRILVGVDGSETAAAAAHTAARLARALGAQLHVVSAFTRNEIERIEQGSDVFIHTNETGALTVADQEASALRAEFAGLAVETTAAAGKPAEILVNLAKELETDLIVVGNKRVQGLGRVLGSIAKDVAQHAPCDVYIAHTHHR